MPSYKNAFLGSRLESHAERPNTKKNRPPQTNEITNASSVMFNVREHAVEPTLYT